MIMELSLGWKTYRKLPIVRFAQVGLQIPGEPRLEDQRTRQNADRDGEQLHAQPVNLGCQTLPASFPSEAWGPRQLHPEMW